MEKGSAGREAGKWGYKAFELEYRASEGVGSRKSVFKLENNSQTTRDSPSLLLLLRRAKSRPGSPPHPHSSSSASLSVSFGP